MENKVRLIAKTVPVIQECESASELIAFCARVSNPSNQDNHDTSDGLLKYCIREKHWSIFEMVDLVIEIETTRDIGRQVLRHRSFCFQEFSQRYASVEHFDDSLFKFRETRVQDPDNRQNSITCTDEELINKFEVTQQQVYSNSMEAYKQLLTAGVAKEQARCVLPEGMTKSRMYMKGSLRSWIHYCLLRMGNGTQKEHQWIAQKCWEIVIQEFPQLKGIDQ